MFLSCGAYEREANHFPKFFTGFQSLYLILRTLQALNFPVRWLRTTVNSTSSPVWSSKPSCTSFTWKNSFLLSPTSYVMKPNYEDKFREKKFQLGKYNLRKAGWELRRASKQSVPDLWRTRPRLCVEAPQYTPSSAQSALMCKPGTSQVLLSEDSLPCSPYSWFQRVFSGLYFLLKQKTKGRTIDLLASAVNNILPSALRHRPSSMTSISPWYSVWEGSTLRKGRMTFPVITVASISSPSAFTASGKELIFLYSQIYIKMESKSSYLEPLW